MSRVKEILEQIMVEDGDTVLYGVMLSFLKRKASELDIDTDYEMILLGIDVETKTIDVYKQDTYHNDPPILMEEV